MKYILIISLALVVSLALYGLYVEEGLRIENERLKTALRGFEKENEQISLKLAECEIGGRWPHTINN